MVICGLGPNLQYELLRSEVRTGFPDPDLFDLFAHSGHRLLTPPSPMQCAQLDSCCCGLRRISIVLTLRNHGPDRSRHLVC